MRLRRFVCYESMLYLIYALIRFLLVVVGRNSNSQPPTDVKHDIENRPFRNCGKSIVFSIYNTGIESKYENSKGNIISYYCISLWPMLFRQRVNDFCEGVRSRGTRGPRQIFNSNNEQRTIEGSTTADSTQVMR